MIKSKNKSREHITISCDNCRKSRKKCDNEEICTRCANLKIECTRSTLVNKRGRKPGTKNKPTAKNEEGIAWKKIQEKEAENLSSKSKSQLHSSIIEFSQEKSGIVKLDEEIEQEIEPMEIDEVNQQQFQSFQTNNYSQRKLTRGSFKSYLRQNARKDWFADNKLKFSIEKNNSLEDLIILPDKSQWLYNTEIIDENQINKWSQQVYQKIGKHWCPRCQRVSYYDGESYHNYCIEHICEEKGCQNEAKQIEQGKSLCSIHFKQQESNSQEQFNAQIIHKGGYHD